MMAGILAGKSALVTGGASGRGRATALAMVREGARVAVADQTEARAAETVAMINAGGGQAIAIGAEFHVAVPSRGFSRARLKCSEEVPPPRLL
jgi:NAD(P)-dependent dehydrogenase (short-subunit alcohol dehydrogenase family)